MNILKRIIRSFYCRLIIIPRNYINNYKRYCIVKQLKQSSVKKLDLDSIDRVLIIAPHPDDEVFGCGMLINELTQKRKNIDILILSKGEAALPAHIAYPDEIVKVRYGLSIRALACLGVDTNKHLRFSDFPDSRFAEVSLDSRKDIAKYIEEKNPSYIFIPHPLDSSPDHKAASDILEETISSRQSIVFYYCVWMYHNLSLDYIKTLPFANSFSIEGDILKKNQAIDIYISAKTADGHCYSFDLPSLFLKLSRLPKEVFFRKTN